MGVSTRDGTLMNPKLYGLRDSQGNRIDGTGDDDGGFRDNSRVVFTPDEGGIYYIGVEAHGNGTGTYTVAVTETETFTDDQSGRQGDCPDGRRRRLGHGHHRAAGRSGLVRRHARCERPVPNRPEGGLDRRRHAEGPEALRSLRLERELARESATMTETVNGWTFLNSYAFFEPDADGTYYIRAGAYMHWTGTYKVQVTEIVDDFAADTTTTGTVAVGGTTMGEIETGGDQRLVRRGVWRRTPGTGST